MLSVLVFNHTSAKNSRLWVYSAVSCSSAHNIPVPVVLQRLTGLQSSFCPCNRCTGRAGILSLPLGGLSLPCKRLFWVRMLHLCECTFHSMPQTGPVTSQSTNDSGVQPPCTNHSYEPPQQLFASTLKIILHV